MKSVLPQCLLLSLFICLTALPGTAGADDGDEARALANNTRFMLFGMQPLGEYQVRKNAVQLPQANATPAGAVSFMEIVSNGDQIILSLTGVGSAPPIPPQQVQARETSPGCVTVTWAANSETDLMGYVVYWGPQSVSNGQTGTYENSFDVGQATSHEICGFAPGTQYFAVRAYNTGSDFSGYSSERAVTIAGVDNTAPAITSRTPAAGATGVPLDSRVVFWIEDGQSGVDSSSVTVTINGSLPDQVTFSGTPARYIVTCSVDGGFAPQTTIDVSVQAADLATPANGMNTTWSFTTGSNADTEAPTFCCLNPADGAVSVSPGSPVSIGVSDAGAGVDLTQINFTVNGVFVLYEISGDEQDAVVTFSNPMGFTPGSQVNVALTACDLSAGRNCASLNFSFMVGSSTPNLADNAIIYPDGYWANDIDRPLEIRGMPIGWVVRIFDLSGQEVRSFKNSSAEGFDWSWDFRNDHGEQVARALYLIRVFDAGGELQRSGRFVVQRDL